MKVLFPIGTIYPSQQGGPSNSVYWMAKALTQCDVGVTIVATDLGAENIVTSDTWLDTDFGRVIYHRDRLHILPLNMLRSVRRCMKNADLVHLTSLFYPPSLFSALLAIKHQKPVMWSPRGELDEKALIYSAWKKKPVLWLIRRFLLPRIVFHSTSPEESRRVREVLGPGAKCIEVPNYMEIPATETPVPGSFYMVCIGRIHPKKALENLIAALPLARLFMQSNITLKIAGNAANAYGDHLKKLVRDLGLDQKVEFTGHIEGREKQQLLAGACLTILPSHTENFGNVVIESLAQGTPVIASKGTPWQVLEQEQAGFHTENTPEKLAAAIDRALALAPDEYAAFRKNALRLAETRFDIQKNIQVWINAYQAILST
jgi:glycosyltransferase involved in cell wall biosynthesis